MVVGRLVGWLVGWLRVTIRIVTGGNPAGALSADDHH